MEHYRDYSLWAHHKEESLRGQDLWYIIENRLPRQASEPATNPLLQRQQEEVLDKWQADNCKVVSIINRTVGSQFKLELANYDGAVAKWEYLKHQCTTFCGTDKTTLLQNLLAYQSTPGRSGIKIFNDLDSMWRKLLIAGEDLGLEIFMNKVYMTLPREYMPYIISWKRDKNLTPSDLKNELMSAESDLRHRSSHPPFYGFLCETPPPDRWLCDSGATSHVCGNRDQFTDYYEYEKPTQLEAIGSTLQSLGVGVIVLEAFIDKKWRSLVLLDVLHIIGAWNLFSELKYLTQFKQSHYGWYVKRDLEYALLVNDVTHEIGPKAVREGSPATHYMLFRPQQQGIVMALQPLPGQNKSMCWHERFGHMSLRKLRDSVRCGAIVGIPLSELQSDINCLPCTKAHMVRSPYKKLTLRDDYKAGERCHIDVAHGGKITG